MHEQIAKLCLSHFLCAFDPASRRRFTTDVIKEVSLRTYSEEKVLAFLDEALVPFQKSLVDEFNTRFADGRPLRYQIVDRAGVGEIVEGFHPRRAPSEIRFQEVLHGITASEFEALAGVVLKILGCTEIYLTPLSHDQGVDAFGYRSIVDPTPYGVTHGITWIAQAKHYKVSELSTGDLRELVGSRELLVAKVFSTVNERYKEMRLRPYAPIALTLVTTEEIASTVRRLADGAGIYVFAASDLYHVLKPLLRRNSLQSLRVLIRRESASFTSLS